MGLKSNRRHTVEEATEILWRIIDEAKTYMQDPMLTSEEKRRWAKTLADTIGVLNKLLASQGKKQLEDEDFALALACYTTKEENPNSQSPTLEISLNL